MAGEEGGTEARLRKLVEQVANSAEEDEEAMKAVRRLCRSSGRWVAVVVEELVWLVRRRHCVARLRCLRLADQLFVRSAEFRRLLLPHLELLLARTVGHDPADPLPPPRSQQRALRAAAILALRQWKEKFGAGYKKLELAYKALQPTVDFQELCLVSDPERLRRREREERVTRVGRERMARVAEEMEEQAAVVEECLRTTASLASLGEGAGCEEEVEGRWRLVGHLLASAEAWVASLTRAAAPVPLLARARDTRDQLKAALDTLGGLGGGRLQEDQEKKVVLKKEEEDPTTFAATVKKVTGKEMDLKMDFDAKLPETVVGGGEQSPSESTNSSIPRVRIEDIRDPARVVVDPERSRWWVGNTREGEVVTAGTSVRVAEFLGAEEAITWRCGADLGEGRRCQRQDRTRCPFHGPIVARDAEGRPLEVEESGSQGAPPAPAESKKTRKRTKLKGAASWDETSRTRLEKKIFNKSAVKRVERDLQKYNKIRTSDKFVDQFNYT